MSDLIGARRRQRLARLRRQLLARPDTELLAAADVPVGRVTFMADSTVYIDEAWGLLPEPVEALLGRAFLFHSAVCLGEIAAGLGRLDPSRQETRAIAAHYEELVEKIPETRVVAPDAQVWAEAGLVAGTLARLQGFQPHQQTECLNDALVLLSAAKIGCAVLTANRRDFDLLQQLCPEGRFVWYSPVSAPFQPLPDPRLDRSRWRIGQETLRRQIL